jgi:hypothetical protein
MGRSDHSKWLTILFAGAVLNAGFASADVQFENSCSAAVQSDFAIAVTYLHSFEYPESTRLFQQIANQDPDCAMAQWGLAMSVWHPLWAPPSSADLQSGAQHLSSAAEMPASARERAYLAALAEFFASSDAGSHRERALAYELAMAEIYQAHLDDPEAATFYALALLASADPHDNTYGNQYKAAALLNWVKSGQPTHPGVLHYLIHSYDYPALAHLGLDSAMVYADAAPDSAHAQHMPSHIFTRLGLWDRSLSSNHDSTRSAAAYTQRAHLPGHYDEGLHSMDYLIYAMLQTARDQQAGELLVTLAAIDRTDTENFKVAYAYAAAPARYALERRQWAEAARLQLIRENFPWADFAWAESIHHFARGVGAARSGQLDAAQAELVIIKRLETKLLETTPAYWREEVGVQALIVDAWIRFAQGDAQAALKLAAQAADREDSVDKHPVTPGEVLPARELYADMLLAAGHETQAAEQYQRVLESSPNRLNALLGAARASALSGRPDAAAGYERQIRTQVIDNGAQRSELQALF